MANIDPNLKPIMANPNRDASDMMRGVRYQIFQTMLAWMNLKDDQVLYMEVAEDFELVDSKNGVVSVQIKDTKNSGNITLRSQNIVDAISNFWELKNLNKEQSISYRYMTTSGIGLEKNEPFGNNVRGLDLWQESKSDNAALERIISFLKTLNLSTELKAFLDTANIEDVRESLIEPISWMPSQGTLKVVQEVIDGKLAFHGSRIGVNAHSSLKSRANFYDFLSEKISQKDKKALNYLDFLLLFEQFTGEWLSGSSVAEAKSTLSPQVALLSDLSLSEPVFSTPIPLLSNMGNRSNIVEDIEKTLRKSSCVFLHGSTGLGKTTLARLVIERATNTKWGWGSFRAYNDGPQLVNLLKRSFNQLQLEQEPVSIVIDDIDLKKLSSYENEISSLIYEIIQRGGKVIITSQSAPLETFLANIGLKRDVVKEVPYLDKVEVSSLLKQYNFPVNKEIDKWANLIRLRSSGHPQLVHAQIIRLSEDGWPSPNTKDFFNPPEIQDVKESVADRIMNEIVHDDTRRLAYRLTLVVSNFTYETAMGIASQDPAISMPGESFKRLLGPWIEKERENLYRASPLMSGLAEKNFTKDEITQLHKTIALSILDKRSIDPHEGSTALMHALIGRSDEALTMMCMAILKAPFASWKILADSLFWFGGYALGQNDNISENPYLNALMRQCQYRIASNLSDLESAKAVGLRMLADIEKVPDLVMRTPLKMTANGLLLMAYNVPYPLEFLIDRIVELKNLTKQANDLDEELPGIKEVSEDVYNASSSSGFWTAQIMRIKGPSDLSDFLNKLDVIPIDYKEEALADFVTSDSFDLLIGNSWWNATKGDDFDPNQCIDSLREAIGLGKKWGCSHLIESSYVAISVIEDEYLEAGEKAVEAIEEGIDALGKTSDKFKNQLAKIDYRAKKFKESLSYVSEFVTYTTLPKIEKIHSLRRIAICYGELLKWDKSEHAFGVVAEIARNADGFDNMHIGLIGDKAYTLWMQEKYEDSILLYAEALRLLEANKNAESLDAIHINAVIRHIFAWLYGSIKDSPPDYLAKPPIGALSNPDPHPDIKDHALVPMNYVWCILSNLEHRVGVDVGISKEVQKRTSGKYPVILMSSRIFDRFTMYGEEGDPLIAVKEFIEVSKGIQLAKENQNGSIDNFTLVYPPSLKDGHWTDGEIRSLLCFLLAKSIHAHNIGVDAKLCIEAWRKDIGVNCIPAVLSERFFSLLTGTETPDVNQLQETGASTFYKLTHASLNVQEKLQHHYHLFYVSTHFPSIKMHGKDLYDFYSKAWLDVALNHKFALTAPRISAPKLLEICSLKNGGLKDAALLLLEAAQACGVRVDIRYLEMLRKYM